MEFDDKKSTNTSTVSQKGESATRTSIFGVLIPMGLSVRLCYFSFPESSGCTCGTDILPCVFTSKPKISAIRPTYNGEIKGSCAGSETEFANGYGNNAG